MGSKSTFSNSTSKSYALSLYELAKENAELDKTEEGINGLNYLFKNSSDFKTMITNPTINKDEKKNVILEIANKNNFPETLKKFLGFLTSKNRLFFLSNIINNFLGFVSENKGELKAKLLSSKKLSKGEIEKIQNELSNDLRSSVKIDYKYEPDLIGGLIIQVGSIMVDNSIKSKLKLIEKNMIEAWYANKSIGSNKNFKRTN